MRDFFIHIPFARAELSYSTADNVKLRSYANCDSCFGRNPRDRFSKVPVEFHRNSPVSVAIRTTDRDFP